MRKIKKEGVPLPSFSSVLSAYERHELEQWIKEAKISMEELQQKFQQWVEKFKNAETDKEIKQILNELSNPQKNRLGNFPGIKQLQFYAEALLKNRG